MGCIRHRVQGLWNGGSKVTSGVGRGDMGERTHSSENRSPCACLTVVVDGSKCDRCDVSWRVELCLLDAGRI